ncbi:membrane lipoprotein lipid attachment site-containing protein [Nonomuraea soli]|uniref:DUF4333 domain-containing protein n=1 Tax=Nonomuraea soli TaxID=1032476 RepID=A0A7W0CUJ3_9ACTN|nr:membrane lipoprotein lipid attachment site-containing protein [Nonomuraea soli]MBA2897440.1 hypothetical protein [Nonomuraea soli]
MKRIISLAVIAAALTACGGQEPTPVGNRAAQPETVVATPVQPTQEPVAEPDINPEAIEMLGKPRYCPDSIGSKIVCVKFTNKRDAKTGIEVEFEVTTSKGVFTATTVEYDVRPGVSKTLTAYVHDQEAEGAKVKSFKLVAADFV